MNLIGKIEGRRQEILEEMDAIRSMEGATLNEQMVPVKHKGKKKPVLRGPYYVLARWENGKTHSRRVSREELAQVKQDVANHKHFIALSKGFDHLQHSQWLTAEKWRNCGGTSDTRGCGAKGFQRGVRRLAKDPSCRLRFRDDLEIGR